MIGAAAIIENALINAASIVSYPQTKLTRIIYYFYFNVTPLGMGKSIHQRLTSNAISFLANQRMEQQHCAFDYGFDCRPAGLRSFFSDLFECRRQSTERYRLCT